MNIELFTMLLINSRLSSQHEAQELAAVFQDECRKWNTQDTVETFCDFLVATNRLTGWQCDKLRMGKWKGFYLDNYLLLEHIGKGTEFTFYKARDIGNGKLVRMFVKPMPSAKSGIAYRVDPYSE